MSYDCDHYKNLIADRITGTLGSVPSRQLDEHLSHCADCRRYAEALQNEDRLLGRYVDAIGGDMPARQQRLMNMLEQAQNQQTPRQFPWRNIMNSPFTKVAAVAAVIIVAVVVGVGPFLSGSVTFAEVVEPILNAKTVILDLVIGDDESGPVMHEMVADSRIRRTISNLPNLTQVLDLDGGRMLVLDSEVKSAVYADIQGHVQEGTKNYVEFLRQVIRKIQDGRVERLDEKVIDGKKAVGFVGRSQNEEITIWADPETAHPVRIQIKIGKDFTGIMKNFQFNEPVDPSLVSMEVPEGYTLQETRLDLSDATEKDFLEGLRIWAEVLQDGAFPDAVGSEIVMKRMPDFIRQLQQRNISEEQGTQMAMMVARGMMFHQMLDMSGGDWHYNGAGVKLGDAGTVIFWYRSQGAQVYRVVYGDLSVRDATPEELPSATAPALQP